MSKPPCNNQLQPLQQPSPHMHFSQFNVPHVQSTNSISSHTASQPHSISFHQPMGAQILPGQNQPTVIRPGFIEPCSFIEQPQFFAAIPVQPMIPTSATVLSPIPPALDSSHSNLAVSPSHNHVQDHLQRKHEELQKLIVQQQDELRRVSEQLFIARYGMLPSIVNVSFPFPAPMDQTDTCTLSQANSLNVNHLNFPDQNPQVVPRQLHSQQQIPQIQIHQPGHVLQQPTQLSHYEYNQQKVEPQMDSEQQQNDDIMQYMHHQHIHQPNTLQSSHQEMNLHQSMPNDDFELMPFQMLNQQAQILFSSGSNDNSSGVASSNSRKK